MIMRLLKILVLVATDEWMPNFRYRVDHSSTCEVHFKVYVSGRWEEYILTLTSLLLSTGSGVSKDMVEKAINGC